MLANEKIQRILAPFTGIGREVSDIDESVEALHALYVDAGYAVVQVVASAQTIRTGKVVLKVIEDKVNSIEVKGNSAYDVDNIRASLPALKKGTSLNVKLLDAAINLANENAAKQLAVNIQPSAQADDISTIINVTEDRISKYSATYDKIGFAWQNANLFNLDHSLTVQFSGSVDRLDNVYSLSLGYHAPLYQRGVSADLIAAYSSSSGQNGTIYFSGKGTVFGTRLNYAFASLGDIRHRLIFGVDIKDSKSVSGPMTTPITENPVSLTYFTQMARPEFQGNTSVSWVANIAGGQHGHRDAYYNTTTGFGAIPFNGA